MGRPRKQLADKVTICPSCERLPSWLRDWPAEVALFLRAGRTPEQTKKLALELWAPYWDQVVDTLANEIRGECRQKFVQGSRTDAAPPWCESNGETDMALLCKRCGKGKIRPNAAGVNGHCDHCGHRYWHCQPNRPELTDEDWAILHAHDKREAEAEGGEA